MIISEESPQKSDVWSNPVDGIVSSECENRINPITGKSEFHNGLDIAVRSGTEVRCVRNGNVIEVGENSGYGKYIKYMTYDGYVVMYAHLSEALVKQGDAVKKGEVVARSGNTGMTTGPHLHYTILLNDKVLDPRKFSSYAK